MKKAGAWQNFLTSRWTTGLDSIKSGKTDRTSAKPVLSQFQISYFVLSKKYFQYCREGEIIDARHYLAEPCACEHVCIPMIQQRHTNAQGGSGQPFLSIPILRGETMAHEQFQSCIEACYACAQACDHCATSCLQEQDVKMMAHCIALDMDCAEICRMAASYMSRGSEFASAICQMCADVCDACGDECAKHQAGHCQECAQACRRCADECRRMAGMGQGAQSMATTGASAH